MLPDQHQDSAHVVRRATVVQSQKIGWPSHLCDGRLQRSCFGFIGLHKFAKQNAIDRGTVKGVHKTAVSCLMVYVIRSMTSHLSETALLPPALHFSCCYVVPSLPFSLSAASLPRLNAVPSILIRRTLSTTFSPLLWPQQHPLLPFAQLPATPFSLPSFLQTSSVRPRTLKEMHSKDAYGGCK